MDALWAEHGTAHDLTRLRMALGMVARGGFGDACKPFDYPRVVAQAIDVGVIVEPCAAKCAIRAERRNSARNTIAGPHVIDPGHQIMAEA